MPKPHGFGADWLHCLQEKNTLLPGLFAHAQEPTTLGYLHLRSWDVV